MTGMSCVCELPLRSLTDATSSKGLAGAAEELAGADREQRAVARPHAALAGDEASARARRAGLREEPGFVGLRSVEGNREVDAGRDERRVRVEPGRGRPAQRVEE